MRTVPYVLALLACLALVIVADPSSDDNQEKVEMNKGEKVVVEDKAKMPEPEFTMPNDSDKEKENEEKPGPLVDRTEKTKSINNV